MVDNKFPPVAASYHWINVPLTCKSLIVALVQKDWVAEAIGADGVTFTVIATAVLVLVKPPAVCEA